MILWDKDCVNWPHNNSAIQKKNLPNPNSFIVKGFNLNSLFSLFPIILLTNLL